MASTSRLTLAFVNKRPASAARVLESLSVDDAAAFIEAIPTRYAIKVLTPLNTTLAVDVVQRLPTLSATAVLRELEFAHAASVIRRIPGDLRQSILAELPDRRRREFETAMEFAADTVGASMSTAMVTASADETVADVLKRVKDDRDGQSDIVFVIDEQLKLLGSVRLSVLARKPAKTVMAELLDGSCAPIAARARISQVLTLATWNHHNELPVVSRRGELIGVLYRKAVAEGGHISEPGGTTEFPSIAESLLQMMVQSAPGLSDLVVSTTDATGNDRSTQ